MENFRMPLATDSAGNRFRPQAKKKPWPPTVGGPGHHSSGGPWPPWRLIATPPDYKSLLNPLQTLHLHFSNRNKKPLSAIFATGYPELKKNRIHRKLFKTKGGDQF
jgi:hypothetical protein